MSAALIGYARLLTDHQNLALQRDALTRAGRTRLYEDRISGDQLVMWRLDWLGHSMSDPSHRA